jgi:anti-sigma factor RsiW
MSCSSVDLKAYFLGELAAAERAPVEKHLDACQNCREELDRLGVTRAALLSLEDQEAPQRIAFVSDKVFEPRWWQSMWHSGPVMGFASAAVLAVAILVHGFARPVVTPTPATVDTAQIEQRVERQVNARLDAVVAKAVADAEGKQSTEFAKTLNAAEQRLDAQHQADLLQITRVYEQRMGRMMVASNNVEVRPAQ